MRALFDDPPIDDSAWRAARTALHAVNQGRHDARWLQRLIVLQRLFRGGVDRGQLRAQRSIGKARQPREPRHTDIEPIENRLLGLRHRDDRFECAQAGRQRPK